LGSLASRLLLLHPMIPTRKVQQRRLLLDFDPHDSTHEDIVISHGNLAVDIALHYPDHARQKGNAVLSPMPFNSLKAIVPFARKVVREPSLVFGQDVDSKMLGVSKALHRSSVMTQTDQHQRRLQRYRRERIHGQPVRLPALIHRRRYRYSRGKASGCLAELVA